MTDDIEADQIDIFSAEKIRKDDQYLWLNRYENPLKVFKIIAEKVSTLGSGNLLDIGAAAGEFIFHLEKNIPNKLTGLEIDKRLIERAQKFIKSPIKRGNVLNSDVFTANQFDIITFLNTHVIFDDLEPVFKNIKRWSTDDASIFVFGAFNPDPADIWIRYKLSDKTDDRLQYGWNIPSIESVSNLAEKVFGKNSFKWEKFDIDFKVEKDPSDFLRQRTISDGKNAILINGLCQVIYPYILEISRKNSK